MKDVEMKLQCLHVLSQSVVVNQKELWCSKKIRVIFFFLKCFGGRRNMKGNSELDSVHKQKLMNPFFDSFA